MGVLTTIAVYLTLGVYVGAAPTTTPATSTAPATPPAISITSGLAPFQVLQRDENGVGTITCAGTVDGGSGEVLARVVKDGKPLEKLDWQPVGTATGRAWSARLTGIPVGGPYRVELQIKTPSGQSILLETENILVGDLWVLAGQSNMQGVGDMIDVEAPSPFVHAFEMNERWAIAEEPLHRLAESPDPVHHPGRTPEQIDQERHAPRVPAIKGTGMGLPFAKELFNRTKVPIGLVPCAHGGTSMEQWNPAGKPLAGASLYGAMVRRVETVGGRVKGMLWYQGESDASPVARPVYRERFTRFIEAVRRDFAAPALPVYFVQISRVTLPGIDIDAWCGVREDERLIAQTVPATAVISAIDLELDDLIHIGTRGLKRLGRRAAVIADRELFGNMKVATGPRLKSLDAQNAKAGVIRVTFENVNGRLRPEDHIAGFSLRSSDGKLGPEFYDVMVDPKSPTTLVCQCWGEIPAGMNLWYGYGLNPYCNLVDELDMASPAFGPIPVTPPASRPATQPTTQAR